MITTTAGALATATKHIVGVTQSKTLPILSMALIEHDGTSMLLTGSDMEIQATVQCAAEGAADSYCLPARQLHDAARNLPQSASITLDRKGDSVTLSSGRSKWKLPTLLAADYPRISDDPVGNAVQIPATQLSAAIKGSAYAAGQNDARYYLNGLYLQQRDGLLHVVGTDGHRLACNVLPADTMIDHIIPNNATKELAKLSGDSMIIQACQRGIHWTCGGISIYTKTIDGRYPDWRRVIPDTEKAKTVVIDRKTLASALSRVSVIRSGDNKEGIRFKFGQGQLAINFANRDGATADDMLEIDSDTEAAIDLNLGYLSDLLSNLDAESIHMHITDNEKPVVVTTGSGFPLHVLMPMRT